MSVYNFDPLLETIEAFAEKNIDCKFVLREMANTLRLSGKAQEHVLSHYARLDKLS